MDARRERGSCMALLLVVCVVALLVGAGMLQENGDEEIVRARRSPTETDRSPASVPAEAPGDEPAKSTAQGSTAASGVDPASDAEPVAPEPARSEGWRPARDHLKPGVVLYRETDGKKERLAAVVGVTGDEWRVIVRYLDKEMNGVRDSWLLDKRERWAKLFVKGDDPALVSKTPGPRWLPLEGNVRVGAKVYWGAEPKKVWAVIEKVSKDRIRVRFPSGRTEWKNRSWAVSSRLFSIHPEDPTLRTK